MVISFTFENFKKLLWCISMKSMNPFYLFLRFSLLFYEIKNFAMLKLSALFSLYNCKFSKYSIHLHVYINTARLLSTWFPQLSAVAVLLPHSSLDPSVSYRGYSLPGRTRDSGWNIQSIHIKVSILSIHIQGFI